MVQEDISDDPPRAHLLHCMPSQTGWAFYQRFVTDHHVYVTDITVTGFTNLDRHGRSTVTGFTNLVVRTIYMKW